MIPHRSHLLLIAFVSVAVPGGLRPTQAQTADDRTNRPTADAIARIRDEGLNRSQVMKTLSQLTEVIGPRLTGSPNLKRANEWTRRQLSVWGLNSHLEAWGPFGRGWSLKRFSAQVVEPQTIPLIGHPNAWSPGFEQPLVADVVYLDVKTNADLENFKGKLRGAIVLTGAVRELKPAFEPLAFRMAETNLLRLANAGEPRSGRGFGQGERAGGGSGEPPFRRDGIRSNATDNITSSTNAPFGGRGRSSRYLSFLAREGAALVVTPSSIGDGGTFFVAGASVPGAETNTFRSTNSPRAWWTNAPAIPPQITLAAEDYNRMVRMIQHGEKLKMAVDLQVQFHNDDPMAYNTIAEIPGTDLKNEVVMLGGHLDSWHSGTGATDNGAGVAVAMEAARILTALKLEPRRTVRIALWTGEEQGLLGSKAYVAQHFGYYTNAVAEKDEKDIRAPKDESPRRRRSRVASTNSAPERKLVSTREYEKFSVYFNLDNGAGKIRGIYMQGNEAVRPIFRRWVGPLADLGAETLTLSNTSGTDHLSFDAIGLPGFEFIQDPMEYRTRTHHSNEDVFDRVQADDLKQAAVVMATFVYNAAMEDEKLPRKPLADAPGGSDVPR
jgi:hypothetical protein